MVSDRQRLTRYEILVDAAEEANKDDQFVAIYGQEFSTIKPNNHTNAFMANKVIKTKSGNYRTVFTDDWMEEHGVELIQFNHPWEAGVTLSELGTAGDTNYGFNQIGIRATTVALVPKHSVCADHSLSAQS